MAPPHQERCQLQKNTHLATLPRPACSIMVQLRTGHIPLAKYLHRFGRSQTPNCRICQTPETIEHYLRSCRRYDCERTQLRKALDEAGFDPDVLSQTQMGAVKVNSNLNTPVDRVGMLALDVVAGSKQKEVVIRLMEEIALEAGVGRTVNEGQASA